MRRLLPLALAAIGCGSGSQFPAFALQYPASHADVLSAFSARIQNATVEQPQAIAVLVPPPPAHGFTIVELPSGRHLGQVAAAIDGRPFVLGDLVVAHVRGGITGWSLDGTARWTTPDAGGLALDGAAREGNHVVLTLGGSGLTHRDGTLIVLDAASGSTSVRTRVEHAMGIPAAAAGFAFVPWDGQNLSLFDLDNGNEVARVRSRDDVIGFARREAGAVYFGARALYRFAPEDAMGHRDGAPNFVFSREDLPGNPPFSPDGYTAPRSGSDARNRVRLAWRADPNTPGAGLTDGTVYAVFYRDVFGLDATTGTVKWAYVHPSDLAGVEVARGGVTLVDEAGHAVMVAASDGRPAWRADLGAPAGQVVFQLPIDFSPPSQGGDAPRPRAAGLLDAASGTDSRLLPAQIFAVHALATMDTPEATRALVAILGHRAFPQDLRAAAGEAVAHRTTGTEFLVEALETHYNYVRQTPAPAVGLIARGIAGAHDARGAAALVSHLNDPATPTTDLPSLVAALRELNDPVALPALMDFVRLYHADVGAVPPVGSGDAIDDRQGPDQDMLNAALEQAVLAIARMGGAAEQRVLDDLLADPNTPQNVRVATARARGGHTEPEETSDGTVQHQEITPPAFHVPPGQLTTDDFNDAFAPRRDAFLACLESATSRPAQVRLEFFYESDGTVSHITVVPATFQTCMAPIAAQVRLPTSLVGREIGTYNLNTSAP